MTEPKWSFTPPTVKRGRKRKKERGPHRWLQWLRGMPMANGQPTNYQINDAQAMAEHLEKCGFAWGPELAALANGDGFIHVSQLPVQQIKQLPPEYGPDIWVNPTGKWVPVDEPDPAPTKVLDLTELSDEQVAAIELEQAEVKEALRRREIAKEIEKGLDPHVREDTTTATDTEA